MGISVPFLKAFHSGSRVDAAMRWLVLIAVFLAPLVFYPSSSDPFETTKVFVVGLLIGAAMVLWIGKSVFQRRIEVRWSILHTLVAAFVGASILSVLFSVSPLRSLAGSSGALGMALPSIIIYGLVFFLLTQLFTEESQKRALMASLFASAGIGLAVLLFQLAGAYIFSWEGTHTSAFQTLSASSITPPIFFGVIILLLIGVFFLYSKRIMRIYIAAGFIAVLAGLIVYDYTRGWLALAVSSFIIVIFFALRSQKLPKWWIFIPTASLALSVLFMFLPVSSWTNVSLPQETFLDQSNGWRVTAEALTQRPFVGTGPQTFLDAFQRFRPTEFNESPLWRLLFVQSSNQWFETFTTLGILGGIAFTGIIGACIFLMIRFIITTDPHASEWLYMMFGGAGWLLLTFASFVLAWTFALSLMWWILLALIAVLLLRNKQPKTIHLRISRVRYLGSVLFFTFFVIVFVVFGVYGTRVWNGERIHALILEESLNPEGSITHLRETAERGVAWNPYSSKLELLLASAYTIEALDAAANTTDNSSQAIEFLQSSLNHIQEGIIKDDSNFLTYQSAGDVYSLLGPLVQDADIAIASLFSEAVKKDARNPQLYFELGQAYLAYVQRAGVGQTSEELSKAYDAFNSALELKPDFVEASLFLALAEETGGDSNAAKQRLAALHDANPAYIEITLSLAGMYERSGERDSAIELLQEVSAMVPYDIEAHIQIAGIYENLSLSAEALEEYLLVQQLDSSSVFVNEKVTRLREGLSNE